MTTLPLPPITDNACPFESESIIEMLNRIVEKAAELSPDKTRHGGYLFVLNWSSSPRCHQLGKILDESKRERYRAFCEEKCRRLAEHTEHHSSFQSQDIAREHYQGAIRTTKNGCLVGFSGRPSAEDEAICLAIAVQMRWMSPVEAMYVATISENQFYIRNEMALLAA